MSRYVQQSSGIQVPNGWPSLHAISDLTPFIGPSNWSICGRCTAKGDIRTFSSNGRDGKVFNFNIRDQAGSEIRISGFTEAVDQFFDSIVRGKTYFVRGGRVKKADPRYNKTNTNYEVTLSRDACIEAAPNAEAAIPVDSFQFIESLKALEAEGVQKGSVVDVCGLVLSVGDPETIKSKATGQEYTKRDVVVGDESMLRVPITLWGDSASRFPERLQGTAVAFNGCAVGEFGGRRQLSMSRDGSFTETVQTPDPRWLRLAQWAPRAPTNENGYTSVVDPTADPSAAGAGGDRSVDKFRSRLTVGQLSAINVAEVEVAPKTVFVKAFVTEVKYQKERTFYYPACMNSAGCKKKVVQEDTGKWVCSKCDMKFDRPRYRYISRITVSDHTGEADLSMFDEVAEKLFGISADEFQVKTETGGQAGEELLDAANLQQWVLRVKCRSDTYNDVARVRRELMGVYPIKPLDEARGMLDVITEHMGNM